MEYMKTYPSRDHKNLHADKKFISRERKLNKSLFLKNACTTEFDLHSANVEQNWTHLERYLLKNIPT